MQQSSATAKPKAPKNFQSFLDKPTRMNGLVREIYMARGWIKATDKEGKSIVVTAKGLQEMR